MQYIRRWLLHSSTTGKVARTDMIPNGGSPDAGLTKSYTG